MPELPEVEVARRTLEKWTEGKRLLAVEILSPRSVRAQSAKNWELLSRARFESVQRRGKNLLITLRKGKDPLGLWSHLGMTGKWQRTNGAEELPRFSRVRLGLDDKSVLHFCDMRLFGQLQFVAHADFAAISTLAALGPDPLLDGIDWHRLAERLGRLKIPIKVALLDQSLLAGIGNIQASEGLFRAHLDPRRPASTLTAPECQRLGKGLLASLHATLKRFEKSTADGKTIVYVEEPGAPNPFSVYGQAGKVCPRCRKGPIERVVQAGRSTFFCPDCQKG